MSGHKIPKAHGFQFKPHMRPTAPVSTRSVRLVRLFDEKNRFIGSVDPETGKLYTKRGKPSESFLYSVLGPKWNGSYRKLRAAADKAGIHPSMSTARREKADLKEAKAAGLG